MTRAMGLAAATLGLLALAAASPCLAVVTVQAAADEEPPERSVLLDAYGWGLPKDGLQLGLFHASDQREFSYGDTLHLVLRARNTGDEPLELCYAPGDYSIVSAMPGNRLTLDMVPGQEPQVLRLEAGEEKAVPGIEFRGELCGPGDIDRDPRLNEPDQSTALLPGLYTVEFPYPLWLAGPTDPNRHTAHRARPGVARFTLLDDLADAWVVESIVYDEAGSPRIRREMPGQPGAPVREEPAAPELVCPALPSQAAGPAADQPIAWGDFVNGLQAGLRVEETPRPRARRAPDAPQEPPGEFAFGFYVWNCTNRRVTVALPEAGDWSPNIEDSEGNRVEASVFDSPGYRAMRNYLLAPGQCLRTGCLRLRLGDKAAPGADQDSVACVEPGRYTVWCVEDAHEAAGGCVHMALPTGRVALDITAADLGREPQASTLGGAP